MLALSTDSGRVSQRPAAIRSKRALGTPWPLWQADYGGQVEDRPVPLPDAASRGGLIHNAPEILVCGWCPVAGEAEVSTVDAGGDPIDRGHPFAEGDGQCCARGVSPHPWQIQEALHRARNAPQLDHGPRKLLQSGGPPDQPQRTDDGFDRRDMGPGQRLSSWPATEESLMDPCDGSTPRALEEQLRHKNAERIAFASPRETAAASSPPIQQLSGELIHPFHDEATLSLLTLAPGVGFRFMDLGPECKMVYL